MGWVLATISLSFYPLSTMAALIMLRRYGGFPLPKPDLQQLEPPGKGTWNEFTVEQLMGAIRLDEENQSDTVRLWMSSDDDSGTRTQEVGQ